ncbi:IS1 transposase [Leclercia adecarboxylata]|uniref:IS1 transposase n=1 Tax=Leclercia adecarboxylata TaxID=83655 RepID=A0A4U9HXK1_9ENTR|nr:IS1 transposase [Leclercia adecarboxylata]
MYESRFKEKLHVISKRYTQRIERHNLNLRQHLARLGRKSLSFSKSVELHDKVIGQLSEHKTLSVNWSHYHDLAKNAELKSTESGGRVILDKEKKTAVSLSLRMKVLRKIDRLADMEGLSRSEAVEKITERVIDELLKESRENEKIRKK